MRTGISKILVTGAAGFIGSAFVRLAVKKGFNVAVVDKLTYAGDLKRLAVVKGKYRFYKADICDRAALGRIFKKELPQALINFAAETHVDRSILDASSFIKTNYAGVGVLLDLTRKYKIKRFLHMSTDEVYGDIEKGRFSENSPLGPNSPYAASKAAADLLIRSYVRTYGFPAVIVRPSNNYGPWQYPEKLIPLSILKLSAGEKVPVYAQGKNVREWLFVDDCADGILKILEKAKLGEIYNLGSQEEKKNIEVVRLLIKILGKDNNLIEFVKDRPGHDIRYALNSSKVFRLGFRPKHNFSEGLEFTVAWYMDNCNWWGKIKQKSDYQSYYRSWYQKR